MGNNARGAREHQKLRERAESFEHTKYRPKRNQSGRKSLDKEFKVPYAPNWGTNTSHIL